MTPATGSAATFAFDALGRTAALTLPGGTVALDHRFTGAIDLSPDSSPLYDIGALAEALVDANHNLTSEDSYVQARALTDVITFAALLAAEITGARAGAAGRGAATEAEMSAFDRALIKLPLDAQKSQKPPGFDPQYWQWREASRNIPEKHWWDPNGGEWRHHGPDNWHDTHWDYNPWTEWNSPWQHIYPEAKP